MGKLLRIILAAVGIGASAGASSAMFAEPFWAELLKRLGVDSAQWVGPMLSVFGAEWFQFLAAGFVGAAVGAWLHWGATKWDRRNSPSGGAPADRSQALAGLANFIPEGDELIERCYRNEEPQSDAEAWAARAMRYLETNFGEAEAVLFASRSASVGTVMLGPISKRASDIATFVHQKLHKIKDVIADHRRSS